MMSWYESYKVRIAGSDGSQKKTRIKNQATRRRAEREIPDINIFLIKILISSVGHMGWMGVISTGKNGSLMFFYSLMMRVMNSHYQMGKA